jgi:hypothetical protein
VQGQLAAQQIYFPPTGSPALASPQIGPASSKPWERTAWCSPALFAECRCGAIEMVPEQA